MYRKIGKQFRKPKGILGKFISKVMQKGNMNTIDTLLDKMDIKENDSVFEIGYGHGLGIAKILSKTNCSISGIDFSELMYKEASRKNLKFIKSKNLELFYGDFLDYNMPINKFDKVFCTNVVYFWSDLEKPFTKIRSSLKKEGQFYFYMSHYDELNKYKFTKDDIFNKHSIEYVIENLKLSGFRTVEYEYNNGYYISCFN